jgi:hypothetical protein
VTKKSFSWPMRIFLSLVVLDMVFGSLVAMDDTEEPWIPGGITRLVRRGEHVLGFHQGWTMFSPSVDDTQTKSRARLVFADGSWREVRFDTSDPPDLTHYTHWWVDRINNYELDVKENDPKACLGYCNLLAHRHRCNDRGRPLVWIELFQVEYRLPGPDVDAETFLQQQSGPPPQQQVRRPFYRARVTFLPDGTVSVKKG